MRSSRWLGRAVLPFAWLVPERAIAAEFANVRLERESSSSSDCATVESTASNVEQRLRRRVFLTQAVTDLSVRVNYSQTPGTFYADVQLYSAKGRVLGHRTLSALGQDCSVLDDSVSLVMALMVDMTRDEVREKSEARMVVDTSDVSIPAPAPHRTERSNSVAFQLVGSSGMVPNVGLGGRIAVELRIFGGVSLEAGVSSLVPMVFHDAPNRGAKFNFLAVDLGACGAIAKNPNGTVALCMGSELGLEVVRGFGYLVSAGGRSLMINPYTKLQGSYWIGPKFGVKVAMGAALPTHREEFYATRSEGAKVRLFEAYPVVPFVQVGFCL